MQNRILTYGYIREATIAHVDLEEDELQANNLLGRLHIFANEAMATVCGVKPRYKYISIKVVEKYHLIVDDNGKWRKATGKETKWFYATPEERIALGLELDDGVMFITDEQLNKYYKDQNIYQVGEFYKPEPLFLAWTNKQSWKYVTRKPTLREIFENEAFDRPPLKEIVYRVRADKRKDYMFAGTNQLKFLEVGEYDIPAKVLWFFFESGINDETEVDMPVDIFLCLPKFVAAVMLQKTDNFQRANFKRTEAEMDLARCSATDNMELIRVTPSWE
jgi:hypothetical protein